MGTRLGTGEILLRALPPRGMSALAPVATGTPGVIFWFRNDLRLHDQPALHAAIAQAQQRQGWLLPVFVHDPAQEQHTPWGFGRMGVHRRAWLHSALCDVSEQLRALGNGLLLCHGDSATVLNELCRSLGGALLVCEEIAAPQEQAVVEKLRQVMAVHTVWQSSLLEPTSLPFAPEQVPDQFTAFRQAIERAQVAAPAPLAPPIQLPPWPSNVTYPMALEAATCPSLPPEEPKSSFPYLSPDFSGGERAALAHLQRYCQRGLPHSYKATRNGLTGTDYSSKWSPWLATGALSARQAWAAVEAFEAAYGANESTYWLWFELLWRDHFRYLHRKHGPLLYRARGLTGHSVPLHDGPAFERWCQGQTGHPWIDAGMRELAATGYLSNRLRQNVASYLIHDLGCDWRAGAAWFEAQLLDYDVYSNQGNWLYLSGRGTDPRGSRRFNPDKQAQDYDPDGRYRQLWAY